jgi:hypothetical protein
VTTVAAAAQVSAAIFTGVMAARTHRLADETKEMAGETKRVAESTERQAKATEDLVTESQQDRVLSWSPYPVFVLNGSALNEVEDAPGPLPAGRGLAQQITINNVGRGHAQRCYYFACERTNVNFWCFARVDAIRGEGTTGPINTTPQYSQTPTYLLELMPYEKGRVGESWTALLCEDVLGNRIRFIGDDWSRNVWRVGDPDPPQWAISPLLWG